MVHLLHRLYGANAPVNYNNPPSVFYSLTTLIILRESICF